MFCLLVFNNFAAPEEIEEGWWRRKASTLTLGTVQRDERVTREPEEVRFVHGMYFDWCVRLDHGSEGKLRIVRALHSCRIFLLPIT